jgi:hypothetical protein
MQKLVTVLIILLIASVSNAQEILIPSGINQSLANHKPSNTKNTRAELKMPFFEDFSSTFAYPNPAKFSDSSVFINTGNAYSPLTFGVATFD